MGYDARFYRPTTVFRNGNLLIYTRVDFYGAYTPVLVEFYAYNAAGQLLPHPFTDSNSLQSMSFGAYGGPGAYTTRTVAMQWVWDNTTVSAQGVTFRGWLYNQYGWQLDAFGPIPA